MICSSSSQRSDVVAKMEREGGWRRVAAGRGVAVSFHAASWGLEEITFLWPLSWQGTLWLRHAVVFRVNKAASLGLSIDIGLHDNLVNYVPSLPLFQ